MPETILKAKNDILNIFQKLYEIFYFFYFLNIVVFNKMKPFTKISGLFI